MNFENLRKFLQELTDIVYRERIVVFGFIFSAIILKSIFYFLDQSISSTHHDYTIVEDLDKYQNQQHSRYDKKGYSENFSAPLFYFDPSRVQFEELVALGFSKKAAAIFLNYRNKGGQFYKKEDVKKIYGVSPELYARIEPYIQISQGDFSTQSKYKTDMKTPKNIDINTANIDEWKSLPGIGDYFAKKIVSIRDGIGAYQSIEQIGDIYGLSDSVFQKIKPYLYMTKKPIRKININEATAEELSTYPYILKWQADDILRHRPIYGVDDLYELRTFSDKSKTKKVEAYFEF